MQNYANNIISRNKIFCEVHLSFLPRNNEFFQRESACNDIIIFLVGNLDTTLASVEALRDLRASLHSRKAVSYHQILHHGIQMGLKSDFQGSIFYDDHDQTQFYL